MAPFKEWTTQLILSVATTKLGVDKPCHDASKPVNPQSISGGYSLSVISWGYNRMDIYGVWGKDDESAHQYWDGYQWGPSWNTIEPLGGNFNSPPSAVSPALGKMDLFHATNGSLMHKSYDGTQWNPSETTFESLGGNVDSGSVLAATVNGSNPIGVFGQATVNGAIHIVHKYYDGYDWQPQNGALEDLSDSTTVFSTGPTAVSWGVNRTDIFALNENSTPVHQYWDGTTWLSTWEILGGAQLIGAPTAISWGANRLDLFGIDLVTGSLLHLAWDGSQWSSGWENLGVPSTGVQFTGTVAANSWDVNRIDIVVLGTDGAYYYKYWDGSQWQPAETTFNPKGGNFTSSPSVVSWSANRLDIYGIGNDTMLKHQTWYGNGWYPEWSFESLAGPLESFGF